VPPFGSATLRADAGRALLQAHPEADILVCDDGLQHWALARDLEVCVMDDRGVGNGWLLPAGPLREPWPRPVDLLLHTGPNDLRGGFRAQRQLAGLAHDGARPQPGFVQPDRSARRCRGRSGHAPRRFLPCCAQPACNCSKPPPCPTILTTQTGRQNPSGRLLLCTEKDATKLWLHQPEALAVPLVLTPEAAFWQALDQRLAENRFAETPSGQPNR
jgi:tetraacyldisaccharide 4'-kinase